MLIFIVNNFTFILIFFIATKESSTTRSNMKTTIFLNLHIVTIFHLTIGVRPGSKKGRFYQYQTSLQDLIFQIKLMKDVVMEKGNIKIGEVKKS